VKEGVTRIWPCRAAAIADRANPKHSKVTTGLLTRAIVERDYLRVSYITDLMAAKAGRVTAYEPGCVLGEDPVTFVGLEEPDALPQGSQVFTLNRLRELVPA
jgi:hypothetical protein